MSSYLNKIRVGQAYNEVKSGVEKGLMNIPGIGEGLAKAVKRGPARLQRSPHAAPLFPHQKNVWDIHSQISEDRFPIGDF